MLIEALILAAAFLVAAYAVRSGIASELADAKAILLELAKPDPAELPIPPCPDCGSTDALLIVGYQGTRRFSCQRCPRIYSATRDGLTFKHEPRALPYSPQVPEAPQAAGQNSTAPPVRKDDRPIPRRRPVP